jgi:hypothetical protein
MTIKVFTGYQVAEVEESANSFLKTIDDQNVVEVKFISSTFSWAPFAITVLYKQS